MKRHLLLVAVALAILTAGVAPAWAQHGAKSAGETPYVSVKFAADLPSLFFEVTSESEARRKSVREGLEQHRQDIGKCAAKALAEDDAPGSIEIEVEMGADGGVDEVRTVSNGLGEPLARCLRTTLSKAKSPAEKGARDGQAVRVVGHWKKLLPSRKMERAKKHSKTPKSNGFGRIHGLHRAKSKKAGAHKMHRTSDKPVASMKRSALSVDGPSTADELEPYLARKENAFKYCYERRLQADPTLAGRVVVGFTIKTDGRVDKAHVSETSLDDKRTEACLVRVFQRVRFTPPDEEVDVSSAFEFQSETK